MVFNIPRVEAAQKIGEPYASDQRWKISVLSFSISGQAYRYILPERSDTIMKIQSCKGDQVFVGFERRDCHIPSTGSSLSAGNGAKPVSVLTQPRCCSVAPFWPQTVQRAQRRSMSLEASLPQRIMSGTKAIGA
jgi:hypothetical protein